MSSARSGSSALVKWELVRSWAHLGATIQRDETSWYASYILNRGRILPDLCLTAALSKWYLNGYQLVERTENLQRENNSHPTSCCCLDLWVLLQASPALTDQPESSPFTQTFDEIRPYNNPTPQTVRLSRQTSKKPLTKVALMRV